MDIDAQKSVKIAEINDRFRKSGFGLMVTRGVQGLNDVGGLLEAVKQFSDFNEDNDPYGEHDFGQLLWSGEKIFWKIDYYDQKLKGYENPLSTECRRVLTVLLADEY